LSRQDAGQAAITLAVVIVCVVLSSFLLLKTMNAARSINKKAAIVRDTAGGINTATDSIRELKKTNGLATSIRDTAKELGAEKEDGRVPQIVKLAKSIDGLASSINGSAGRINGTAKSINGQAAAIVGTAKLIAGDVRQINVNVDGTIGLANGIKSDTGAIVLEARSIHKDLSKLGR